MKYSIIIVIVASATQLSACEFMGIFLDTANTAYYVMDATESGASILTVDAGPDLTATEGDTVELTGSAADSAHVRDFIYEWTQTNGPKVKIASLEPGKISFVAPAVDDDTSLSFRLRAGASSIRMREDFITVLVEPASASP